MVLCVHNLLRDFRDFLWFSPSPELLARRRSVQRLVPRFIQLERLCTTSRFARQCDRRQAGLLQQFPFESVELHVNDSLHCAILHALLNSLLRIVSSGQHNSFRNSLLRNHLDILLGLSTSVSLRIVNVVLLDHVLHFLIRELLTHTFLHVALNLGTR